ncbi:TetR/AcrR family transcriptional regulator [Psychrobacillus psychrodurans]|uniref:TetR/AcrR family transcriptional regulator n=1 Tax=Psychrobacillus psychrodurans TaxID=126157 RepID=A0A9X3L9G6_9BACI|nr:TetR/AcrR family transcriptional regulator [Psychrobacillus psychrodurans]MCZ8533719.1 TetR/AcrR family transcriptional regulator [Psychrobacillus psychrodurans]
MSRPREYSAERIFQGIHSALSKYGYTKLTLDNIAKEIIISPAALSKRFGSKKNLLLFYMDTVIKLTTQSFVTSRSLSGSKLHALKSLLIQSLGKVEDAQTLANITSLFIESVSDMDFLEYSQRRLQLIDEEVQYFLRAAIEDGELLNIELDQVETTARILQGAITGSLMIWLNNSTRTLEQWLDDCFNIILKQS